MMKEKIMSGEWEKVLFAVFWGTERILFPLRSLIPCDKLYGLVGMTFAY